MAAPSQPGDVLLVLQSGEPASLPENLLDTLYETAEAKSTSLTKPEFAEALTRIGTRLNHNLPTNAVATVSQQQAFYQSLHLKDLALAQACALGHELAWQRFLALYRTPLTQAAIAITRSATLGHDLADSLYAELYGLRASASGDRKSPLLSYTGRGSFLGWLRTTIAQRHIDHHRRTHRESPLESIEPQAPISPSTPENLTPLQTALTRTFLSLPPEDRFLLATYYLDRRTLLEISRLLKVHEATISRRLKRLTESLRKLLLKNLQSAGLDRRAAQEALGTDPRDLELNLHTLLQPSQLDPFPDQTTE